MGEERQVWALSSVKWVQTRRSWGSYTGSQKMCFLVTGNLSIFRDLQVSEDLLAGFSQADVVSGVSKFEQKLV